MLREQTATGGAALGDRMTLMARKLCWILWLLLWHAASSSNALTASQLSMEAVRAQQAGSRAGQQYVSCADGQIAGDHTQYVNHGQGANAPGYDGQVLGPVLQGTHPHPDSTTSLHHYVYNGDFESFRQQLTILSRHENFPRLLGALQASDDRGTTIVHLLACSGRSVELAQLMEVVFRMQGDGVEVIRRIVLESRNENACKGRRCDALASERPGLYAHGTLQFADAPHQVVLFGDVTPIECAAAHGHVQALKLLVQAGVAGGKAFEVASIFSMTQQFHQAIHLANAEGFFAQPQIFLPAAQTDAPKRQPRVRRGRNAASGAASAGSDSKQKSLLSKTGSEKGHKASKTASKKRATPTKHVQPVQQHQQQQQQPPIVCSSPHADTTPADTPSTAPLSGRPAADSAAALVAAVAGSGASPSAEANVISSTTRTTTGLSEALDIAALLLLTGMLLLPVWSTLCLLWRRTIRKRAAVQEPARRIKQAMLANTAGSQTGIISVGAAVDCSGGGSPAVAAAGLCSAASAGLAGSAAGRGNGRKGRTAASLSGSASGKPKRDGALFSSASSSVLAAGGQSQQQPIPMSHCSSSGGSLNRLVNSAAASMLASVGSGSSSYEGQGEAGVCAAAAHPVSRSASASSSNSNVHEPSAAPAAGGAAPNKHGAAESSTMKHGAAESSFAAGSKHRRGRIAVISSTNSSVSGSSGKDKILPNSDGTEQRMVVLPSARNGSPNPAASGAGGPTALSPKTPNAAEAATGLSEFDDAPAGLASAAQLCGVTKQTAAAAAAGENKEKGRRSHSLVSAASNPGADAQDAAACGACGLADQQCAVVGGFQAAPSSNLSKQPRPQQHQQQRSRGHAAARKPKHNPAVTATALQGDVAAAGAKQSKLDAACAPHHRSVKASGHHGRGSGNNSSGSTQLQQLRVLSADHAAQQAKAYVALIAPYTPSASAAHTRPAIYQPPGSGFSVTSPSGSTAVAAGTSMVCADPGSRSAASGAAELLVETAADDDAVGDADSGRSDCDQGSPRNASAGLEIHALQCQVSSAGTAAAAAVDALDTAAAAAADMLVAGTTELVCVAASQLTPLIGMPESAVDMSSAEVASGRHMSRAGDAVDSCFSGPAAFAGDGSLSSGTVGLGGCAMGLPPLHMQLSSGSSSSWMREVSRDPSLCSSSSGSSSGAGSFLGQRVSRLADGMSFNSDGSCTSSAGAGSVAGSASMAAIAIRDAGGISCSISLGSSGGQHGQHDLAALRQPSEAAAGGSPFAPIEECSSGSISSDGTTQSAGLPAASTAQLEGPCLMAATGVSVRAGDTTASLEGGPPDTAAAEADQEQRPVHRQMSKDMRLLVSLLGQQPLDQVLAAASAKVDIVKGSAGTAGCSSPGVAVSDSQLQEALTASGHIQLSVELVRSLSGCQSLRESSSGSVVSMGNGNDTQEQLTSTTAAVCSTDRSQHPPGTPTSLVTPQQLLLLQQQQQQQARWTSLGGPQVLHQQQGTAVQVSNLQPHASAAGAPPVLLTYQGNPGSACAHLLLQQQLQQHQFQQQQQMQQQQQPHHMQVQQQAAGLAGIAMPYPGAQVLALGPGAQQQNMMLLRGQPRVVQQQGGVAVLPPGAHTAGAAASGPLMHIMHYPQVVAAASGMPQQQLPAASVNLLASPGAVVTGSPGAPLMSSNNSSHNVVRMPASSQHQPVMLPSACGPMLRGNLPASHPLLQQQMHVLQLQHGGFSPTGAGSTAMLVAHDAGQLAVGSPPGVSAGVPAKQQGPGVTFVGHQVMGLSRSHQHQAVMVTNPAAATAGIALTGTDARGSVPSRQHKGNNPTASQQLLAMATGLQQQQQQQQQQQPQQQQQQQQQQQFDWTQLAADLTAGSMTASGPPVLGPHQLRQQQPGDGGHLQKQQHQQLMLLQQSAAREVAVGRSGGSDSSSMPGRTAEPWLTVLVPDPPSAASASGAPSCRSHSESARMAAELDELLHQASQQLGWSAIPQAHASAGDVAPPDAVAVPRQESAPAAAAVDGGAPRGRPPARTAVGSSTSRVSPASSATGPAVPSKLRPSAAAFEAGKGAAASAAAAAAALAAVAAGGSGSRPAGLSERASCQQEPGVEAVLCDAAKRLKGLEGLQLPDGFCSSDD